MKAQIKDDNILAKINKSIDKRGKISQKLI